MKKATLRKNGELMVDINIKVPVFESVIQAAMTATGWNRTTVLSKLKIEVEVETRDLLGWKAVLSKHKSITLVHMDDVGFHTEQGWVDCGNL